jgi:ElaB/YqjD/DUF883 family membrane-anchored ribosome-binding protein
MSHAEQLEREAEQTRAQIASTLEELRACMTPGHVLDQLADRVSDGSGLAFARNLRDQAVRNPMPIALMGASLAWLMLGGRLTDGVMRRGGERLRHASDTAESVRDAADRAGKSAAEQGSEWSDKASRVGRDIAESVRSTTEDAKQAASRTGDRLRDTASSMSASAQQTAAEVVRDTAGSAKDSVQQSAAAGYDAVADTARRTASSITESTKAAGRRTLQTGSTFLDFCREQPMLLTGVGIAVGALVGALLPATEAENRLMGETSDSLKDRAQDLASDQIEGAQKIGERAFDAAANEASERAEGAAQKAKPDEPTLVPRSETSERETRGQPWSPQDAPL